MRRVVLKHRLNRDVCVIRTGPRPVPRLVAEQDGAVCVWVEVDQTDPDLHAPVYSSTELVVSVIGTGWTDSITEMHSHLGSFTTRDGLVWHVYLVDAELARQTYEGRKVEAARVLRRTEFGHDLRRQVAIRDRHECRFCASHLDAKMSVTTWQLSPHRLEYVVLDLGEPLSIDNVVQACARCDALKGITPLEQSTLVLRHAPQPEPAS